jgi:hypothetical protein
VSYCVKSLKLEYIFSGEGDVRLPRVQLLRVQLLRKDTGYPSTKYEYSEYKYSEYKYAEYKYSGWIPDTSWNPGYIPSILLVNRQIL